MKIKLTNLFMLIILAFKCSAQEKSITLVGNISSNNKSVGNVHIINLSTYSGTISNGNGEFEISISENDTLLISSIEYHIKKIVITESQIKSKNVIIELIPSVTILKEVFLKGLTGNLEIDGKRIRKDTIPKHNFVLKKSDLKKSVPSEIWEKLKEPNAQRMTDPIQMNGVGGKVSIPDKRFEELRKFKNKLSQKKQFPIKITQELGVDFFTNSLNIPEESIHHFISYCEYRNIIDKYYDNKLLEVIEIFHEESIVYNAIKN